MLLVLSLFALSPANAAEPMTATPSVQRVGPTEYDTPIVAREVHTVTERSTPQTVCDGGFSGAYNVNVATQEVTFLYPQFKQAKLTCGDYIVAYEFNRLCSTDKSGDKMLCSQWNGYTTVGTDGCWSRESALTEQVSRLEGCPGITPAPRPSPVTRRATVTN